MLFKKSDFDADKWSQYFAVREAIATIYCDDECLIDPISVNHQKRSKFKWKKNSRQKSFDYQRENRIIERKQRHKTFILKGCYFWFNVFNLVFKHYDSLIDIWDCSANT